MKTIEEIIDDMFQAATNSYAAKIANCLENDPNDGVTVRQAVECLRDDDKAIFDWANELKKALDHAKKTLGRLHNGNLKSMAEVRRIANNMKL